VKAQNFRIRLHIVSPVHIGCDDVYEPTSFIIDEKKKKLIEFDPLDFVESLLPHERSEFSKIASGDDLLNVFKVINRFYKPSIKSREVDVSYYLVNHYKKILELTTYDKKTVINQFVINKTAYNPYTTQPYIPGSSLKGAIRTAYLNIKAKELGIRDCWVNYLERTSFKNAEEIYKSIIKQHIAKEFERKLLNGEFNTDPFRMVKVSDLLPVERVKTKIVYAINRKKQKSDKRTLAERGGVYQIFEVIQPGAVFEGVININAPITSSGIKFPITADKLMASLNKFYVPLLENEIKTLKGIDISVPLINEINSKFKGKINKTAFIVSIGRHSGAEAVTIEGNRLIKIMQGRDREGRMRYEYKPYSTTIWLASDSPKPQSNNGLLPFGWAVLDIVNTC
jgi:CRISPR-associated protein Csm5